MGRNHPIQRQLVLRFQRLFPTVDLFDDGACGSRPDEERGVGVVLVEVVIDGHLQVDDGVEHATTYALRVISAKKRSTRLSQDADVGVKCMWKRG